MKITIPLITSFADSMGIRLDWKDEISDHSSFSKNRHGGFREGDAFRKLFESVVWRCMTEELIGDEGFATDAKPAV